jgi:dihydroflavonol-4-reductase
LPTFASASTKRLVSRFLVTGAAGFLGRHLVRALVAEGHRVRAFVRNGAPRPRGDENEDVSIGAQETVTGDVLSPVTIAPALADCDGVFHCAGKVSRKPEDAELLYKLHVDGTKNVLEASIAAGVRRAVVASTSGTIAVSDDPDHVATENDEPPIGLLNRWPYYRSKLFAEKAALERNGRPLSDGRLFEVVCVNPTLLLGPGDLNGSSTEDVRLFLDRKIPAIPPGGLSYVDVRDVAVTMVRAMERGLAGRRYLLGASNLTVRELFGRLERISGVRGPLLPMPERGREIARAGAQLIERLSSRMGVPVAVDPVSIDMAHFYWYLDASLAEAELDFSPRDPIETLADTVRDLEERGVVWPTTFGDGSILSNLRRRVTRFADDA